MPCCRHQFVLNSTVGRVRRVVVGAFILLIGKQDVHSSERSRWESVGYFTNQPEQDPKKVSRTLPETQDARRSDILSRIVATKEGEVVEVRRRGAELRALASDQPPTRGFRQSNDVL